MWYREEQLMRFHAGETVEVSYSSIVQWNLHPGPYRQTGNRPWTTIVGVDLINLAMFITAWPDATIDEMAVFIYNKGRGLYSCQAIFKRLEEMDITKKRVSSKGYQTQHPDVQFNMWGFLIRPPPPFGILGATKETH